MPTRLIRLRFWRRLQKSQQQVEGLGAQAEQHIEQHLFKRFQRLVLVRRFVFTWVGLLVLLIGGLVMEQQAVNVERQPGEPQQLQHANQQHAAGQCPRRPSSPLRNRLLQHEPQRRGRQQEADGGHRVHGDVRRMKQRLEERNVQRPADEHKAGDRQRCDGRRAGKRAVQAN